MQRAGYEWPLGLHDEHSLARLGLATRVALLLLLLLFDAISAGGRRGRRRRRASGRARWR